MSNVQFAEIALFTAESEDFRPLPFISNSHVVSRNGATGARLSIAFDDETTGVQELKNSKIDGLQTGVCYNLKGQRVSQPTKGLYIVNGKKVIMK